MCAVWSLKLDDSSWSGWKNRSIFVDRPSPQVPHFHPWDGSPKISSNSCEFMVHLTPIVVPWSLKHGHLSEASSKKLHPLVGVPHLFYSLPDGRSHECIPSIHPMILPWVTWVPWVYSWKILPMTKSHDLYEKRHETTQKISKKWSFIHYFSIKYENIYSIWTLCQ